MKRGHKPKPTGELIAQGTFRPVRHGDNNHQIDRVELPQMPDDLTEEGHQVWLDNVSRVSAVHGATEFDSELFAMWCNLQGRIRKVFMAGECPRIQALSESRKMMELLRIGGPSSRVSKVGPQTISGTANIIDTNPFARNGRDR